MRLHRFYISEQVGEKNHLTIKDEGLLHQWRKVFRYKVRDMVILFDGSGYEYECSILLIEKTDAVLQVVKKRQGIVPHKEIWLFFSLIKKDNNEFILQKCTELGVSHFVPMISRRSEKKNLNIERAKKIIIESSEQCGRSTFPILHEVVTVDEVMKEYGKKVNLVAFDPSGETPPFPSANGKLGLLIGPEGGFADEEVRLFKQNNIPVYSLGTFILRAETAAIAAVAKAST